MRPSNNTSQWFLNNNFSSGFPSFEDIAVMVVDSDFEKRSNGEKLLKEWGKKKSDCLNIVVNVLKTTQDTRVVVIGLLFCGTFILNEWTRRSEKKELYEKLEEHHGDSNQTEWITKNVLPFIEALTSIAVERWQQATNDSVTCRNSIFFLITRLIKKGFCDDCSDSAYHFHGLVKSLMNSIVSYLESFDTWTFSNENLMCVQLFVELCQQMQHTDTASLGIVWESYLNGKKSFEKNILLPLFTTFISFLCHLLLNENDLNRSCNVSFQRFLNNEFFLKLLKYLLTLLEIFLDWDFAAVSSEELICIDLCFMPTTDWYDLIFQFQYNNKTVTLINILIELYVNVRWALDKSENESTLWVELFYKMTNILKRLSSLNLTRMKSQFHGLMLSSDASRSHLTSIVYIPFLVTLLDLLTSSQLIQHTWDTTATQNALQRVGMTELACVWYCLSKIMTNLQVDMATVLCHNDVTNRLKLLDECSTYLMKGITLNRTELCFSTDFITCLETLRLCYSSIAFQFLALFQRSYTAAVEAKKNFVLPNCMESLKFLFFNMTNSFLLTNLNLVNFHDEDNFDQEGIIQEDEDYDKKCGFRSVPSSFVNEGLKHYAIVGQCCTLDTCQLWQQAFKSRFVLLIQNTTGVNVENSCQEIVWLLGYMYYFLNESHADSYHDKTIKIPFIFLTLSDATQSQIPQIFTLILQSLIQLFETKCLWDAHTARVVESCLLVLNRLTQAYFFRKYACVNGQNALPQFNDLGFMQESLCRMLACVDFIVTHLSNHVSVSCATLELLISLSYQPTCRILIWELPIFQNLVEKTISYTTETLKLSDRCVTKLFQIFTSFTLINADETMIRQFYNRSTDPCTLNVNTLSEGRVSQLLTKCTGVRDTLIESHGTCQTLTGGSPLNPDPYVFQMKRLFCLCDGILQGIHGMYSLVAKWISPVLDSLQSILTYFKEYPTICLTIVKFLCSLQKKYTLLFPTRHFSISFLPLVQCTLKKVDSMSHQWVSERVDDLDSSDSSSCTLENILGAIVCLLVKLCSDSLIYFCDGNDSKTVGDCNTPQVPQFIFFMLNDMNSLLLQEEVLLHTKFQQNFCNLLYQLVNQYPDILFGHITLPLAHSYCKIMSKAIHSNLPRCRSAASDAISAFVHYLAINQRKQTSVSYDILPPANHLDILSEPNEHATLISLFEHYMAHISVRLLFEVLSIPKTNVKKHHFYSDLICDIFLFLSVKMYNLKRVLDQLKQLTCYSSLGLNDMTEAFVDRVTQPVLTVFYEHSQKTQQAIQTNMSQSLQNIKLTQFRTHFRDVFMTLILAHRLDGNPR
ncbi:uncharacterized protein LOC128884360 isoform X2 [Hylaeus volcanicus]|uniref:uncharacterized protein LOC128884360 isoform X2 n=1 Tax=Hylaeus volcanicus TaxID=313075 RepID=UPI0023B78BC3|nr:uncharacterized protein LOC128884360 isoform X2 [Hylaeus volcanicus]